MSSNSIEDLSEEALDAFLAMSRDRDKIAGGDRNSPLWGMFLIMESMAQELRRRRDYDKQEPEFDGTDGAHPAWWRGQEDGVRGACRVWREALEGNDLRGRFSSDDLNDLYLKTLALVSKVE